MKLRHYFHIYATGAAEHMTAMHLARLKSSGLADALDGGLRIGIVGTDQARLRITKLCKAVMPTAVVAISSEGFEQVTLDAMYDIECFGEGIAKADRAILYAHTKGVSAPSPFNDAWRESMTKGLIDDWRYAVRTLELGRQAIGCHWLTPEAWPDIVTTPFFGGNWWWIRADAMADARRVGHSSRFDAERWLGDSGIRDIDDVAPGWPGYVHFR